MALIYCKLGESKAYLVNPYWCDENWFIKCTDDELIIGVTAGRVDIKNKTLMTRMRKVLRDLGIRGKPIGSVYWDSSVFRREEGGRHIYMSRRAGICDLSLKGPIRDNFAKYLDHGSIISGMADLENQTIYNKKGAVNVIGKTDNSKVT